MHGSGSIIPCTSLRVSHTARQCSTGLTHLRERCRDVLEGLPVVLRYIARAGGRSFLYGTDALTACQVP